MRSMWYFAYGSNLNQQDLGKWCDGEDLPRLNLREKKWARATLHNFTLVFDCFSRRRNCGAANILSASGPRVRGVSFEIDEEEFRIIARKEGAPRTYVEKDVELALENGLTVLAKTFCCQPGREQSNQKPSREYLDLIIEGAIDYGLDQAWIEELRQAPTA